MKLVATSSDLQHAHKNAHTVGNVLCFAWRYMKGPNMLIDTVRLTSFTSAQQAAIHCCVCRCSLLSADVAYGMRGSKALWMQGVLPCL